MTRSSVATKLVSFVSSDVFNNSFCCIENSLGHKLLWWFPFFLQYTHALVELHYFSRCLFLKKMKQKSFALDFLLRKLGYSLHSSLQCCFPQHTHILLFVSPTVNDPVDWLLLSDPYRWYLAKSPVSPCLFSKSPLLTFSLVNLSPSSWVDKYLFSSFLKFATLQMLLEFLYSSSLASIVLGYFDVISESINSFSTFRPRASNDQIWRSIWSKELLSFS